jgi:hypothetical protein
MPFGDLSKFQFQGETEMSTIAIVLLIFVILAALIAGIQGSMAGVSQWGPINAVLICPHCQTKGRVRTKPLTRKAGISGAKATGALLTAGVSLLATGLSRKENVTQAHCDECNSTWVF